MTRRFTGWHMAGILVAFFAVVIAVNSLMATLAVRSFGGTVVDNSYVASQNFNRWLDQAKAQERLGWKDGVTTDPARHVVLTLADAEGTPITGATISAVAQHPLGRAADVALALRQDIAGRYVSDAVLPAGRWQMRLHVRHDGANQYLLREID